MNRTTLVAAFIVVNLIGPATSFFVEANWGTTSCYAQTTDSDTAVPETTSAPTAHATPVGSSSTGVLLILLFLILAALFYFLKLQRPSLPDFSGIAGRDPAIDNLPARRPVTTRQKLSVDSITSADKAAFQQLLTDVQRAWSKQDLIGLQQFVTSDMLNYFSSALADNRSQGIQNHVEDVVLLRAEILEAWTDGATHYVMAGLRWSARDYNLSLTKKPGEPGYVVEGNEKTPTESGEAWTFMRSPDGNWLLSSIQ